MNRDRAAPQDLDSNLDRIMGNEEDKKCHVDGMEADGTDGDISMDYSDSGSAATPEMV